MTLRKFFLLLIWFIFPFLLCAQEQYSSLLDKNTTLSKGSYTLQELLDQLNSNSLVSITYNGNELPLESVVFINESNLSLRLVLESIITQLPVQYQVKNTYIILRNKRFESKYTLQGTIVDSETGEKLVGVNVYVPKDFIGSVTNNEGQFLLRAPPGEYSISLNCMGYIRKQIDINLNTDLQLDIQLEPAKVLIDEVNIISQKNYFGNLNLGRSIASIDAEEIDNLNVNNVADILHAREPGVWTTKISGAPGDHQRIRIRGIHSIYSGVDPLYVVDGVPIPNVNLSSLGVNDVNIHDIERVTILKDISSAAIYGFQGGNGVVLIDTKMGGENRISFTSRFGIQRFDNYYRLMNTKDFLTSINTYSSLFSTNLSDYYPAYHDTLSDTDWQKKFFHPSPVQEYVLTLMGSSNALHYYFSGSYFNQNGVLMSSDYKKYTYLMNLGRTFYKRFSVGLNYHAALQNNYNNLDSYMGNTQILRAITQAPCAGSTPDSLIYSSGRFAYPRTYYSYPALYGKVNADSIFIQNSKTLSVISHSGLVSLNIHLFGNLYLDASTALSYRRYNYESKASVYWNGNSDGYLANYEKYYYSNQRLILSYAKSFEKNEINIAAGIRSYRDRALWEIDSTDKYFSYESGNDELFIRNSLAWYGEIGDINRKINSWVGHLSYTYNKKYSLSIASDYDQLQEGKFVRSGVLFPSVAVNWDISREPLINRLKWIDVLSIYTNWGRAGNYPLSTLAGSLFEDIPYIFGDSASGVPSTVSLVTNYHLKQEEMEEFNYGIHFSAFNKRVEADANFFRRSDRNLIVQNQLPIYAGGGRAYVNIAAMNGSGKEYGLELIPVLTSKLTWFTRFGYSQFHQVVRKLNTEREIQFPSTDILIPAMSIREGEELGNIIGYQYVGPWTNEDEQAQSPEYFNQFGLKYKKYDTTSINRTPNDKTVIGNSIPDYTWSWYNSFTTGRFSLDFLWYAVMGFSKYNATRAATYMAGVNTELIDLIADSINAFSNRTIYESSYFVEDASFIRLKHITLTYHPLRKLWNNIDFTISLSLENLLTITKYKGYDPEATIYTGNTFTDNAIDRGAYPTPKAAYISIGLKF
jgi:TonB-linked SusC/RagA family outer membrane protein